MTRRPVPCVGAFVRDDAGRILLVRRGRPPSQGKWSVPGGRQEYGETARDAAIREVREETGLDVRVGEVVLQLDLIGTDPDGEHYAIVDFSATVVGGRLRAGDDADEVGWFDLDAALALDLVDSVRAALPGLVRGA